jgi:hypothetical protein
MFSSLTIFITPCWKVSVLDDFIVRCENLPQVVNVFL